MSGYICRDLLIDIFERLPPKSIIRFRSLSKHWHSHLISSEFLHDHRLRSSKNPPKVIIRHIAFGDYDHEFRYIYTLHSNNHLPLDRRFGYAEPGVEFPYSLNTIEIVGSCNGILCLFDKEVISLWNFSIRRKLIVPNWKLYYDKAALGFGFNRITDDYNIVAISYDRYALEKNYVFIYSLKTDSWSAISSPSTRFYDVMSNACFHNGILHWVVDGYLTKPSTEELERRSCRFILTFDLSSHVFGHILLPRHWRIIQLTVVNDRLAIVYSENRVIWRILEVESWSVPFQFEASVCDVMSVFQPVTNGDLVAFYDGRFYNLQTNLRREVSEFGPDCFILEMELYVESLELLDNERATNCGETIVSWTKEDISLQKNSLSQVLDDECSGLNYTD